MFSYKKTDEDGESVDLSDEEKEEVKGKAEHQLLVLQRIILIKLLHRLGDHLLLSLRNGHIIIAL